MKNYTGWLSSIWGLSLIIVWVAVAVALRQPLWRQQASRDLVAFGAIRGDLFTVADSWRLVASQWLHVKPPHMLLNVVFIVLVGRAAEKQIHPLAAIAIGIAGGTLGQLLAVIAEPHGYISGASQAYMCLAALVLIMARPRSAGWIVAMIAVVVGFGLDIMAVQSLKPGHYGPLIAGTMAGLVGRFVTAHRTRHQV